MPELFRDQSAIVTGAASGVGHATARMLAEAGAHVVAVDIDTSVHESFRDHDGDFTTVVGDARDPETARAACVAADSSGARLGVLVSNAGYLVRESVTDIESDAWQQVMDVNVGGYFQMARLAIPIMKELGGGSIVATSSISGVVGRKKQSAYCASKGAINQLTRQMAIDYAADNIRVNAVAPGAMDTPFMTDDYEDPAAALVEAATAYPMGRLARVDEVAKAILFLASNDASFITGHILMVDGGYSAQ